MKKKLHSLLTSLLTTKIATLNTFKFIFKPCLLLLAGFFVYTASYSQCQVGTAITGNNTESISGNSYLNGAHSSTITVNSGGVLYISATGATITGITIASGGIVHICGTGNTITFNTFAASGQIIVDASGTGNTITKMTHSAGTLTFTNNLATTDSIIISATSNLSFVGGTGGTFTHGGTGITRMSGGIQGPSANNFTLNVTGGDLRVGNSGNISVDYNQGSGGTISIVSVSAGAKFTTNGYIDFGSNASGSSGSTLNNQGTTVIGGVDATGWSLALRRNGTTPMVVNGSSSNSSAVLVTSGGIEWLPGSSQSNDTTTLRCFTNYGFCSIGASTGLGISGAVGGQGFSGSGWSIDGNKSGFNFTNYPGGTVIMASGFRTGGGTGVRTPRITNAGVLQIGKNADFGGVQRKLSIAAGDATDIYNGSASSTSAILTILGHVYSSLNNLSINNFGCVNARSIHKVDDAQLTLNNGSNFNFNVTNVLNGVTTSTSSTSISWSSNFNVAVGDYILIGGGVNRITALNSNGLWGTLSANATSAVTNTNGITTIYNFTRNHGADWAKITVPSGTATIQMAGMGAWPTAKNSPTLNAGAGNLNVYYNGTNPSPFNNSVSKTGGTGAVSSQGNGANTTVCGTLIVAGNTLTALTTPQGTPSVPTSFLVGAVNNMAAGILVTPPSGFEVCLTVAGTYTSTVTVGAAGAIPLTTVYVRLIGTTSGTYSGNIVLTSSGVTTVNVATVSSIVVAPAGTITTGTITGTNFCPGSTVSVPFTFTGTITSFGAQLSDASGSFAAPTTLSTSGSSSPLTVTIPSDATYGTGYRIRVTGTPLTIGTANGANLTINALTVNISATSAGPSWSPRPSIVYYGTTLNLSAAPSNGSGSYNYSWSSSPSFTFTAPASAATSVTLTPKQNLVTSTVLVTDVTYGCTKSASFLDTVSIPYRPTTSGINGITYYQNGTVDSANAITNPPIDSNGYRIPGKIWVYNYNTGSALNSVTSNGGGIDYYTVNTNSSGSYRPNSTVHFQTNGGELNIGDQQANDSLSYTVNIATTGTYTVTYALSRNGALANACKLKLDGVDIANSTVSYPSGGDWGTFLTNLYPTATITISTTGIHTLKFVMLGSGGLNMRYIDFASTSIVPTISGITAVTPLGTQTGDNNGYNGQTITITGTNFVNAGTTVSFNGGAAQTPTSYTGTTSLTVVVPDGATGPITVTTSNGTSSGSAFTNFGYISIANAEWNAGPGTTWLGGAVPSTGSTVTINNAVPVNTATNTIGSLTINNTKSISVGASGNLSISGTFTNNGTASVGTAGAVTFIGAGSIGGSTPTVFDNNLILNGATTLTTVPTVNGSLQLNSGATVSAAPTYGSSSTLIYNTGGNRTVGTEWTSGATSNPGVPANVQIGNGAASSALTLGAAAYTSKGNLTFSNNTGAALTMTSTSTLNISGNWVNNTSSAANFTANTSTINFNGAAAQSIGGSNTNAGGYAFNSLAITNTSGTSTGVTLNSPVTVSGTFTLSGGVLNTTATNILSVTNTATAAISGGTTNNYVKGPVKRSLLTSGTNAYNYPVGSGTTYLPFVLNSTNTTGSNTATAQAFAGTSVGTADGTSVITLSTTEYWSLGTAFALPITSTVSLSRPSSGLSTFNLVGASTTSTTDGNGTYSSAGGSITGSGNSAVITSVVPPNFPGNTDINFQLAYAPLPIISYTVSLPTVSGQAANTGYTGQTLTITLTNYTTAGGVTVTIGGQSASATVVDGTTVTAMVPAAATTGTVVVTNTTTSASASASFTNNLGYISIADADWNTGSTWAGGNVPPASAVITINNTVGVSADPTGNPLSVTILSGKSLAFTAGTLTLVSGGTFTNNGTAGVGSAGAIAFAGAGTINGSTATTFNDLILNGTTTLTTVPTVNGNLQFNSGATVSAAPTYGSSSTLIYNTGGNRTVGTEWTSGATTGAGVPANVQIGNGAASSALTLGAAAYTSKGNLTFSNNTGAALTMTSTSTLNISGNWVNNTSSAANFTANTSTINFNGAAAQSIGGSNTNAGGYAFNSLAITNTSGTSTGVTLNSPVTVSGTFTLSGGVLNTTATNILSVTNTATAAISGGTTNNYVKGPVKRSLLTSGTNAYNYPVGSGTTYLPFVLNSTNTTGSNTATAQAFAGTSVGTADGTSVITLSTTEYWSLSTAFALPITSTVSLSRPSSGLSNSPTTFNLVGASTTSTTDGNGTYSSAGGNTSGSGNSAVITSFNIPNNANINFQLAYAPLPTISYTASLPTVSGQAANSGFVGQTLTITLTDFTTNYPTLTGMTVTIGGQSASATVVDATHVTAIVPAGATSTTVVVTNTADSKSASAAFATNGYISTTTGTWNTGSTWLGGSVPVTGSNVIIANSDVVTLSGAITQTGSITVVPTATLALGASLTNSGGLAVNGSLQFNTGGNISVAPVYGVTSTLVYTVARTASTEWSTGSSGAGIPQNVTINASGVLVAPNGAKTLLGNMNIVAGTINLGGTLSVGGNWTCTSSDNGLQHNTNTVNFNGSGDQTITMVAVGSFKLFHILAINKTSSGNVMLGSDITIATGGTITNNCAGTSDFITTGRTVIFAAGGTVNGSKSTTFNNLTLNNTTTLTTAPTINGTLTFNANASVTAAPFYGASSTLLYVVTTKTVGTEWGSGTSLATAGTPQNVTINATGTVTIQGSNRNTMGNIDIIAGNLTINFLLNCICTGDFIIEGTGSFTGTSNFGGILSIKGNWINNSTAGTTFTAGGSIIAFNGTTAQTIGGTNATGYAFNSLTINNSAGVTLNRPASVTSTFTLTSGLLNTDATNILSINNTASGGTSGGSATSYINGPVKWTLGSASSGTYTVPVGVSGNGYYPLAFVAGSNANNTTITVQALAGSTGGNPVSPITSISSSEYWKLITSSGFAASSFSLARSTPAVSGAANSIGASAANAASAAVDYNVIGGSYSATAVSSQPGITGSNGLSGASTATYLVLVSTPAPITKYAQATGDWATTGGGSIWYDAISGGTQVDPPTILDPAIINSGVTATLSTAISGRIAAITVNGTLAISGTGSLTTNGGNVSTTAGGAITVASGGTLAIGTAVVNAGSLTVNGTLQLNSGGSVTTNVPVYASGSTLYYAVAKATSTTEWSNGTTAATAGVPYNVTIDAGSGNIVSTSVTKYLFGNLTILSGTFTLGADIYVAGNWTRANSGTTFNPSGKYVSFNGASGVASVITVTGGGTEIFNYFRINNTGGLVQLNHTTGNLTDVTVNTKTDFSATASDGGTIDVNGQTFTQIKPGSDYQMIDLHSRAGLIKSTATGGTFRLTRSGSDNGDGNVVNGGTLLFTVDTVAISGNIGTGGVCTVNNVLKIEANGAIHSNAFKYGPASTLLYTVTTSVFGTVNSNATVDWAPGSAITTAGVPQNVTIDGRGTNIIVTMPAVARTIAGNLNIIQGTLVLSSTPNANLSVGGNWTRASGTTFTPNNREVIFKGATGDQTINTSGGETFDSLTINKATSGSVVLASNTTVTNALTLASKLLTTTGFTLSISKTANTGISGGSTNSYINGPVTWTLGTGSTGTYTVPVGVSGAGYYPLAFVAGSNTGSPTINVQAFTTSPAPGTADGTTIVDVSTTEYWKVVTTSGFEASSFSIGRSTPAVTSSLDVMGKSSTNGPVSYSYFGGSYSASAVSGQGGVTGSNSLTGGTTAYLILAVHNHPPVFDNSSPQSLTACYNSAGTSINSLLPATDVDLGQTLTWSISTTPAHGTLSGFPATAFTSGSSVTPTGLTYIPANGYSGSDQFIVQVSDGIASVLLTINVTVNAGVSGPTAGNGGTICSGSTLYLTASTVEGATGYTWSGPNGFLSSTQNPVLTNAAVEATGTYYVAAIVNGCNSLDGTTTATVNAMPATPTPSNNGPLCEGSTTLALSAGITGVAYAWTGPNGFTSTVQNPQIADVTIAANGIYSVTATANGCTSPAGTTTALIGNQWKGGGDQSWFNNDNWSCGSAPSSTADVVIPSGKSPYPVIDLGIGSVHNISIQNGASVIISGTGRIQVAGAISTSGLGKLNVEAGILELNGDAEQTLNANTLSSNAVKNLVISNDAGATIANTATQDSLNIIDLLSFGSSSAALHTGDNIILRSILTPPDTIGTTARVGMVGTDNVITGKVTVERYIAQKRAWRLITSPLKNTNTIRESWQNNGIYVPGKGTHITGANSSPQNGLDFSNGNSSMKMYDASPAVQNFTNVINTNDPVSQSTNLVNGQNTGYFLFVRGDRNPAQLSGGSSYTTLSSKGELQTGQQVFKVINGPTEATQQRLFTLIGNPYASPIDYGLITKTNINYQFYVWDPRVNQVGIYVTVVDFGGIYLTNHPDQPGDIDSAFIFAANYAQIQSSEAFFVEYLDPDTDPETGAGPGTAEASLEINEDAKSDVNFRYLFRPLTNPIESFKTSLYLLNADNSIIPADGALAIFNSDYNAGVTNEDAIKFGNVNESMSLVRGTTSLAIEKRPVINSTDTLFLNLTHTSQRTYRFKFSATNMAENHPGMIAILEDSYLGTAASLDLTKSIFINFNINSDPRSAVANRFRVVFVPGNPVPVTYSKVKAWLQNKDIAVEWEVGNELNIREYQVEKSTDGRSFTKIGTVKANGNGRSAVVYKWLDAKPVPGVNYYRIYSIDNNAAGKYSQVVKVTIGKAASYVSVYPNPVKGGEVRLQLNSMPAGLYKLRILNGIGQLIQTSSIQHAGGSAAETILLNKDIAKGIYQLEITGPGNEKNTIQFLNE